MISKKRVPINTEGPMFGVRVDNARITLPDGSEVRWFDSGYISVPVLTVHPPHGHLVAAGVLPVYCHTDLARMMTPRGYVNQRVLIRIGVAVTPRAAKYCEMPQVESLMIQHRDHPIMSEHVRGHVVSSGFVLASARFGSMKDALKYMTEDEMSFWDGESGCVVLGGVTPLAAPIEMNAVDGVVTMRYSWGEAE